MLLKAQYISNEPHPTMIQPVWNKLLILRLLKAGSISVGWITCDSSVSWERYNGQQQTAQLASQDFLHHPLPLLAERAMDYMYFPATWWLVWLSLFCTILVSVCCHSSNTELAGPKHWRILKFLENCEGQILKKGEKTGKLGWLCLNGPIIVE